MSIAPQTPARQPPQSTAKINGTPCIVSSAEVYAPIPKKAIWPKLSSPV